MNTEIIVALLSLAGSAIGTFSGIVISNKLINYRLSELEKKVEKHNSIVERMYKVERDVGTCFLKYDTLKEEVENRKED